VQSDRNLSVFWKDLLFPRHSPEDGILRLPQGVQPPICICCMTAQYIFLHFMALTTLDVQQRHYPVSPTRRLSATLAIPQPDRHIAATHAFAFQFPTWRQRATSSVT
jgi:hypothetical protein